MSKYVGKLLLESKVVDNLARVRVKYLSSRRQFCFDIEEESGYKFGMFVGQDLCLDMFSMTGMLECQYQFSIGYAVRQKKDVSELKVMKADELNMLGGRRALILSGALDNDDDFNYLCVIQYLFKVSDTVLRKVMRLWKRRKWGKEESSWLELDKRALGNQGRKPGSKNHVVDGEAESIEDTLLRIEHNKKAAVAKGMLSWYIEACKEECRLAGEKFDKKACLASWDKLRLDVNVDTY